jgi:hypothetical protein
VSLARAVVGGAMGTHNTYLKIHKTLLELIGEVARSVEDMSGGQLFEGLVLAVLPAPHNYMVRDPGRRTSPTQK